jgi:hypothetical protein
MKYFTFSSYLRATANLFWWHRHPHYSILVGNIWSDHEQQLFETAATHSKESKGFFFGYIHKSLYSLWNWPFSNLWLTNGCTQNFFLCFALALSIIVHTAIDSTKSNSHLRRKRYHWHSFHRLCAQPTGISCHGCFTVAAKKPLVHAMSYYFSFIKSKLRNLWMMEVCTST